MLKQKPSISKISNIRVIPDKRFFENCPMDKNKECRMTKTELCKAITDHYMIRNNIISAILTSVQDNGYCERRLMSLKEGKICLPKSYLGSELQSDKLIYQISTYVIKNKLTCNNNYLELSAEDLKKLQLGDNPASKLYLSKMRILDLEFRKSLNEILEILNILDKELSMNNEQLFKIVNTTKKLLDKMYFSCQKNYILAICCMIYSYIKNEEKQKELLKSLGEL